MERAIIDRTRSDPTYASDLVDEFRASWTSLVPFLTGERPIHDRGRFDELVQAWVRWWPVMVMAHWIPDITDVAASIRAAMLQLREETQAYSDADDETYRAALVRLYPVYADVVDLVTPPEVVALRAREWTPDELHAIRQRRGGCALLNHEVVLLPHLPAALARAGLVLERDAVPIHENEFRGTPAARGVVRGKVHVILAHASLAAFRDGEVLVTAMTTPDFVPAMKRVSAIITDEGGVTCHAAIVARELGKPCVIGTKVATAVLRDGDEVEVDADQGVVRIIKRAP